MSYDSIGRRYAQAIFEIAREENAARPIAEQMQRVADAYRGSDELATVLENPLVPPDAREAIILEVADRLGVGQTGKKALRLVTQKRRLRALPDIASHLGRLVDEAEKTLRAEVTSASPLSDAYLARLKSELEKATQHTVLLTHSVDPSLIGGVITRIGDRVLDGSLRSGLTAFRDRALAN